MGFTVAFALTLQFEDRRNLENFLNAASFLGLGRNPYSVFAFPPPPGFFLVILPTYAAYIVSGCSLTAANFSLKLFNLAALLTLSAVCYRLVLLIGAGDTSAKRVRAILLTSPFIFFVSYVHVEQDIVGLTITLVGLYLAYHSACRPKISIIEESVGIGLIAVAAFMYYFPILLLPTVFVYSTNRRQVVRRAASVAIAFGGLGLLYFVALGWNIVSSGVGATSPDFVSVFSVVQVFSSSLFSPQTSFQSAVFQVFLILLGVLEIAVPCLLRWRGVSWTVSVTIAMILPLLLLNLVNGDEFVWALPFLLIALSTYRPSAWGRLGLWLVQVYGLPSIIVFNLFDAPGPGGGTGVYYLSYPQFGKAVALYHLVGDYTRLTQALDLLTFLGLLALIAIIVVLDVRERRSRPELRSFRSRASDGTPAGRITDKGALVPALRSPMTRGIRPNALTVTVAIVIALSAVVVMSLPSPRINVSSSDEFPVGLFSVYPIANQSLTYGFTGQQREISIQANTGNPEWYGTEVRTIGASRNVSEEYLDLEMSLIPQSPSGFSYNSTVLSFGGAAINLVTPWSPPPPSSLLPVVRALNVSNSVIPASPQFTGMLPSSSVYSGRSYAEYNVSALLHGPSVVTIFYRVGSTEEPNYVAELESGPYRYALLDSGITVTGLESQDSGIEWVQSTPQLVNPLSWHEVEINESSSLPEFYVDGVAIHFPTTAIPPTSSLMLIVGSAGPMPLNLSTYSFEGRVVGPYLNSDPVPLPSIPSLCAVGPQTTASTSNGCGFLANDSIIARYGGTGNLTVSSGAFTVQLESTSPLLSFGRLSPVGPGLTLQVLQLQLTSSLNAMAITLVVVGSIITPAFLAVLVIAEGGRLSRRRNRSPSGDSGNLERRRP